MEFKNLSLLIVAGGKSSRLGVDKRFVEVGGVAMLENILRKAAAFDFAEKFLCVEGKLPALETLSEQFGAELLLDKIRDSGESKRIGRWQFQPTCPFLILKF